MSKKPIYVVSLVLAFSLASSNVVFGGIKWEVGISSGSDAVEEGDPGGNMDTGSSDLEMPYENTGQSNKQVIGLRFLNVDIPKGTDIVDAYIEFTVDETKGGSEPVSLLIEGELTPDAAAISSSAKDVTNRTRTTAKVVWGPVNWTSPGIKDQTSNIASVIQEIINQDGWAAGNALVLIISDNPDNPSTGLRCAVSGSGASAPWLHIEFGSEYATEPMPADGSVHEDTWVNLGWSPGSNAVSRDVYFGENFDAVTAGTSDTFQGNQASTMFVAGFVGFPYPDGLVPGTTYYWRIDEVDADGTTWKGGASAANPNGGEVWSFMIQPRKAYNPTPADGSSFITPDVELSWMEGFGAKLHTVYFSENFDDVNSATGGSPQGTTTYTPGTLEMAKTYYWRVDEFDAIETYKGDVWSFTTTLPGLGTILHERWENIGSLDELKSSFRYPDSPDIAEELTSFSWDQDLENYGARIHGWLYAPTTGNYTFWLNADNNGELWLSTDDDPANVKLIAQESTWSGLNTWEIGEEQSVPILLQAGNKYYISALWQESGGDDHCQVAWAGPGIPGPTIIPGTNLTVFKPVQAYGAKPSNQATDVKQTVTLSWKPGDYAVSHEVYFGTDKDAVKNADNGSPEYKGTRDLGSESYDPGMLEWDTTYYWRIDEVNNANPDSPWPGILWSFTTANFLVVDDFESYNDLDPADPESNRIFNAWIDGYDDPTNGSLVGYDAPPFAEQTIVHGGNQSMPLYYDNSVGYSEATLTLTYPRDWTENGVTTLTIWFRGNSDNAAETLYVALNGSAVVSHDNPDAAQITTWTEWTIDLQAFADQGVNLSNVNTIILGLGNKNNPLAGGSGTMYFDDIRLYPPPPTP
jgi:hypothetical protein